MKQNIKKIWRIWAKALGQKGSPCNRESDYIAILRTFILLSYIITNCFIVSGVIRHWNSNKACSSTMEVIE